MKLLMCMDCGDIFSLNYNIKTCTCQKTQGRYIDPENAEIKGYCKAIGFDNKSFNMAYIMQALKDEATKENPPLLKQKGVNFVAFIIPESETSVKRIP